MFRGSKVQRFKVQDSEIQGSAQPLTAVWASLIEAEILFDSIHKPPRPVGMRIEKVLPLPGDPESLI